MISRDSIPDGAAVGPDPEGPAAARRNPASAGFGSPGEDSTVKRIDLNDALIRHPQATFVMRARGSEMHEAGIDDGDVLLVDRVVEASNGSVVIAVVEGELVCRCLWRQRGVSRLYTSAAGEPVHADGDSPASVEIWGVVTTVIRSLLR